MALWHYPLAPPWVPMPQVYLPHPFYAPVVSEYTGQVGIDTRFVNPELGYGFQNLPAARGYQAGDDSTGVNPSPEDVDAMKKSIVITIICLPVFLGGLYAIHKYEEWKKRRK